MRFLFRFALCRYHCFLTHLHSTSADQHRCCRKLTFLVVAAGFRVVSAVAFGKVAGGSRDFALQWTLANLPAYG